MRPRITAVLALGWLVCAVASNATAAPVSYGDFLGTNLDYLGVTENSPTDPTPLFEAPTRVGDSLLFFPTNYAASSANGVPDTTVGILTFDLEAKNGETIDVIRFTEVGDYTLTTPGSGTSTASVAGALIVTVLEVGGVPVQFDPTIHFQSASLVANPAVPYVLQNDFFEFDIFTATAEINLAAAVPGATKVQVQFNNILNATSETGTTAFIQKKSVNGAVVIEVEGPGPVIPEPSTVVMAAFAAAMLLSWRVWNR